MSPLRILIDILIKPFEGCRLKAYPDPGSGGKPWTCGWGSTGRDIDKETVWTQQQADMRMGMDALDSLIAAIRMCPTANTAGRQAALGDFVYNLGATRLKHSTLRKRVLAGDWEAAAYEIKRWKYGGGKVLPGLVRRRAAEAKLFTDSNR
jgi:lysozyme